MKQRDHIDYWKRMNKVFRQSRSYRENESKIGNSE